VPAAFIGHGFPMNTLQVKEFTESWRAFGRALATADRFDARVHDVMTTAHQDLPSMQTCLCRRTRTRLAQHDQLRLGNDCSGGRS
jgi:aromatic ring-opening dioxygenase catalytic subunit (LigB family)